MHRISLFPIKINVIHIIVALEEEKIPGHPVERRNFIELRTMDDIGYKPFSERRLDQIKD